MKSTISLIHDSATMLRVLLLAAFLITAGACAQTPAPPSEAEVVGDAALALPDALIGTWRPYGKGYQQFGDLVLGKEVLSWSFCQNVRYRVFNNTEDAYRIEQTDAPPCDFDYIGTRYLVLVPKDKELQVSICRSRDEFDKPPTERYCSWGTLYKQSGETDR